MGKLFGLWKTSGDDEENGSGGRGGGRGADSDVLPRYEVAHDNNRAAHADDHRDVNETSPLLQQDQHQHGGSRQHPRSGRPPLDPDDPAVTPMNLWTVRILRIISILLLYITSIWWALLVISTFVSPPGMHSRGGGWTEIAFTSLTVGILMLLVMSFVTPSMTERVLLGIISVILLVDMIVIVAVERVRKEEGWTGIVSAVWAIIMCVWSIMVDRITEWGKKEEEVRLTGRAETRRSLRQWFSVFATTVMLVVFLVIAIFFTGDISMRAYDSGLRPEGQRFYVDDNKYEVHLFCTPFHSNETRERVTVFVEGGEHPVAGDLGHWVRDAYQDGTIGRYCYWDRPGFGWSDNAPSPLSAGMAVDALSEALVNAGEDGPFILLSHGVGSIYSRIFAARHGRSIKGMLLINPLHEELLPKLASPGRGFVLWLRGIISPMGFDNLWNGLFRGRTRQDRIYGRNADESAKFIKAKFQESLAANSFTKTEIGSARAILPRDIPLVVVSSGKEAKKSKKWDDLQRDLTNLTDNLVSWDVPPKASHRVWEDREGSEIMARRLSHLIKNAIKHRKDRDDY